MGSQPQSRSSSISAPAGVASSTSLDHGLYSGGSVHSTPSFVEERPLFSSLPRTVSYTEGASYSPWDYISFDKCYTESDDQSSQSFGSITPEHSPLAYFGEMSPEQLSPQHEYNAPLQVADTLYMAPTNVATSVDIATSASYIPPPSGPLFERRRRSATTSMIPSPMTVIASSLSAWSRDDLMTSRPIPGAYAAPPHPTNPHAGHLFQIPVQAVQAPSMQIQPADMQANDMQTQEDVWQQTMSTVPAPTNLLAVSLPEYDLDRTPRGQFFPQDAQVAMAYPPSLMVPMGDMAAYPVAISEPSPPAIMEPFDLAADLEAYNLGLRTFGIGGVHDVYGAPGFDDVNYGQLCYPAAEAEQNA
ncbi:hypothetical protein C8Q80DRAFT_1209550 [Daedaleopsis nitida]|nr:hypothetical protein C8Q80DRAFT_1209550 [Daedaleopsis nitida]